MRKLIFSMVALLLSIHSMPHALAYDCPRGDAAMEAGDFDGAIRSFTNCLAVVTDQEEKRQIFLARGDVYLQLEQLVDANLDYQVALALDRRKPDTQLRLSHLTAAQGNYYEAIDHATAAIDLEPGYVDGYRARGFVRREYGFTHEALADLTFVVEHRPEDLEARVARADVLRATGSPHEAMVEVDAVLAEAPDHQEALELRQKLIEILERIANQ